MLQFDGNTTERLTIRVLERRDIEDARRLHNENSTLLRLTDVTYVSEAQQEGWFTSVSTSRTAKRFTVIETSSGGFVGVFRVDALDLVNRSVCVGLDISPGFRGKGYAKEVYQYFFDYYFNQVGLHRIYLCTLATNAVALNLYSRLGMVEEGRQRQAVFRDGAFVDLIWMSILRPEYDKLVSGLAAIGH